MYNPDLTIAAFFGIRRGKVLQKKLQTFQNRCIRFIENFDSRKHIDVNNFDKLNWMNVKYRIDYLTLSQVYNIVIRKCPSYMIDLIEFKSHSHCTRSGPLFVKSVQTYGKQSFVIMDPFCGISLPGIFKWQPVNVISKTF